MSFRHSKIVCTIGPASRSPRMIDRLLSAGMDVARLNFSHGTREEHAKSITLLRAASGEHEKPIAILADLQGPKIRTGPLAGGGPVLLRAGQRFVITTARVLGDSTRVNTVFTPLPKEVHRGNRILLSDGLIELRVEQVRDRQVVCTVVNGGALGEHKGINLPGVKLRVPAMTPKDREDLAFALKHGADYIAVSFVRRPEDVLLAKQLIRRPVITATQMLESMTENPRPTRAEASDVANAIFDASDAVMLSAETATGKYPVEAVDMMARVIEEAEASIKEFPRPAAQEQLKVAGTVAELVCHASRELHMKLIAVFTHSGFTARLVSRYRPLVPIVAFSPEAETRRRMALIWGVCPRKIQDVKKVDGLAKVAERRLLEERLVRKGDVIGIVAGTPMGIRGTTNFMKFHVIGGPA